MDNIIIDTNPLVYIYHDIPGLGEKYASLFGELSRKNILVIPKIVYGELSLIFLNVGELDTFLEDTGIIISEIKPASYITAAKRWARYNKHRVLMCHRCGEKAGQLKCAGCGTELKFRQHILTDFLIGAFALETKGRNIVTHDAGYFSSYFPELNIITSKK